MNAWLPIVLAQRRLTSRWLFAFAALVCVGGGAAPAQSIEVHDLEAHAGDHIGQERRVTGRFKSASPERMLLVDSQIEFRLNKNAGRVGSNLRNVEVVGRLSRQADKLVFAVEHLTKARSEAEVFADKRRGILDGDYARLYVQCRWLRERADWYRDDALARLAAEHYRQAFRWEEEAAAKAHDPDRLRDLAERGLALGLETAEVDRIRHRAAWEALQKLVPADEAKLRKFAAGLAETWPTILEAGAPWTPDAREHLDAYLADPASAYAAASAEQRGPLRRALWLEVMGRALEAAAREDHLRLAELAREAERDLPERPELAQRLRLQDARRQARDPLSLSRGRALALHKELAELGHADEAQRLVSQWLGHQRRQLDAVDAEGYVRLAADYRELLGDDAAAGQLYLKALQIAPDFAEAETALRGLGYRKTSGVWQRKSGEKESEHHEETSPTGRGVRPGDTEQEVVRRLRRPDRITRTLSAGYLSELWIYDGPPRLLIYLKRSPGSPTARVVSLHTP